MDSFLWVKVAAGFPAEVKSESADQIVFRVFDDHYTITRRKGEFRIQNSKELTTLQASTLEKIQKFVIAKRRTDAALSADQFKQSIHVESPDSGYRVSSSLFQCSSDLPAKFKVTAGVVGRILSHTWLQNGAFESFGMPFTDEGTYFGGRAHIRTPDSFIERKPKHLKCSPVFVRQDATQSEEALSKKAACIARKMSIPQDPVFDESVIGGGWVPHFDYHVLGHNCLKAVRFMLECAGAKAPKSVNLGIGGSFEWDEVNSVSEVGQALRLQIIDARDTLEMIRKLDTLANLDAKANQLVDQANWLDAEVRGQSGGTTTQKTLREICDLMKESCES